MKKIYLVTALACCALQPTLAQKQEECKPVNLHCDHLINPLGIDNANPRLSWMLNDARQGARQTAYQIIVSTDSLNENGEIWNSGKKESDQILVTYPEKNLQPFTKYYWKVNVWDKDGKKATSDINSFETGMMGMENWQGALLLSSTIRQTISGERNPSDSDGLTSSTTVRFRRLSWMLWKSMVKRKVWRIW